MITSYNRSQIVTMLQSCKALIHLGIISLVTCGVKKLRQRCITSSTEAQEARLLHSKSIYYAHQFQLNLRVLRIKNHDFSSSFIGSACISEV